MKFSSIISRRGAETLRKVGFLFRFKTKDQLFCSLRLCVPARVNPSIPTGEYGEYIDLSFYCA